MGGGPVSEAWWHGFGAGFGAAFLVAAVGSAIGEVIWRRNPPSRALRPCSDPRSGLPLVQSGWFSEKPRRPTCFHPWCEWCDASVAPHAPWCPTHFAGNNPDPLTTEPTGEPWTPSRWRRYRVVTPDEQWCGTHPGFIPPTNPTRMCGQSVKVGVTTEGFGRYRACVLDPDHQGDHFDGVRIQQDPPPEPPTKQEPQ